MKFVYGTEAIVHRNSAIIADLHMGMEEALARKGVRLGDFTDFLVDKTAELLRETKAKRLVVLGDVKENVAGLGPEVRRYFGEVCGLAEVIVCRGNHDGGIERVPNIEVVGPGGFVLGGMGLFHGNAWPAEELLSCRWIMMGHNHPQLTIVEEGRKEARPVWLVCPPMKKNVKEKYPKFNRGVQAVVAPAFNPLLGKELSEKGGLGPVFRNKLFKWNGAIVYTLGGTRLGKVSGIAKRM